MKITEKSGDRHQQRIDAKALPMGFKKTGSYCKYTHPDIEDRVFDFSATNPDKLALVLFKKGMEEGKIHKQNQIKDILGISTE